VKAGSGLGIEEGVAADFEAGLGEVDAQGVELGWIGGGRGVEGEDVVGVLGSDGLGDFRGEVFAGDDDLATALVGEGLQAEAAGGGFLCGGHSFEEGVVVVVAEFGLAHQVRGGDGFEGDLRFAQDGGELDQVVEEVFADSRAVVGEFLLVEQGPTRTEPEEKNSSRDGYLLCRQFVESGDGSFKALVQAGQWMS